MFYVGCRESQLFMSQWEVSKKWSAHKCTGQRWLKCRWSTSTDRASHTFPSSEEIFTNFEVARVTQSAHPFKLGPTAVVCREPTVTDICPSAQTDETEEMEANEYQKQMRPRRRRTLDRPLPLADEANLWGHRSWKRYLSPLNRASAFQSKCQSIFFFWPSTSPRAASKSVKIDWCGRSAEMVPTWRIFRLHKRPVTIWFSWNPSACFFINSAILKFRLVPLSARCIGRAKSRNEPAADGAHCPHCVPVSTFYWFLPSIPIFLSL